MDVPNQRKALSYHLGPWVNPMNQESLNGEITFSCYTFKPLKPKSALEQAIAEIWQIKLMEGISD